MKFWEHFFRLKFSVRLSFLAVAQTAPNSIWGLRLLTSLNFTSKTLLSLLTLLVNSLHNSSDVNICLTIIGKYWLRGLELLDVLPFFFFCFSFCKLMGINNVCLKRGVCGTFCFHGSFVSEKSVQRLLAPFCSDDRAHAEVSIVGTSLNEPKKGDQCQERDNCMYDQEIQNYSGIDRCSRIFQHQNLGAHTKIERWESLG